MSKSKKIKKVGEIWMTKKTLERYVPEDCVVNKNSKEINLKNDFPIILRFKSGIKYEVFAENRNKYEIFLRKLKFKNFYYDGVEFK